MKFRFGFKQLALAVFFLAGLLGVVHDSAWAVEKTPAVKLVAMDDVIVVSARDFPGNVPIDVTATVPGGKGATELTTNSSGRALVGFSLPDTSFTGTVTVVATSGATTVTAQLTITEVSPPTTAAASTPLLPSTTATALTTVPPLVAAPNLGASWQLATPTDIEGLLQESLTTGAGLAKACVVPGTI